MTIRPCDTCEALVMHIPETQTRSLPVRHAAPCGELCLAGGLPQIVRSARRYHGSGGRCPCEVTP